MNRQSREGCAVSGCALAGSLVVVYLILAVLAGCLEGCSGERFDGRDSWDAGKGSLGQQVGGQSSASSSVSLGGAIGGYSSSSAGTGGTSGLPLVTGGAGLSQFGSNTGGSMATGGQSVGSSGGTVASTGGNASGPKTPCEGICENPTRFALAAGSFNSGYLGIGASCWETFNLISSGISINFEATRVPTVNGQPMNPTRWVVPPMIAQGWCVSVPAGDSQYANFQVY